MKTQIWHGSPKIIEKPIFGFGKQNNDYGMGFYCTQERELAKEWACPTDTDGYANHYAIETSQLKILNLSSKEYSILNWLALLVANRRFQATSAVAVQGIAHLKEYFLPDIREYDAIIGYRVDDSYFSFARAFVNNTISVDQLAQAASLDGLFMRDIIREGVKNDDARLR